MNKNKYNLFQTMLRDYFIIFSIIIILTASLNVTHSFTFREIMLAALFALAGNLPSLIYYSKKELSIKSRKIRMLLHFILIEVVVLSFGNLMGQVSGIADNLIFALEILGIYILVILVIWLLDRKTANEINQQLASLRSEKNITDKDNNR
ncbi:MAG: hypothetical protein K0R00_1942 [Herbinix sp.]|nr:hypothetical protein [Herbinix sp.]